MKHSSPTSIALLLHATSSLSSPVVNHETRSSDQSIFTLHDITYSSDTIYSTPAHLAVSDASIQFNLTNSAVTYITECSALLSSDPAVFYGNQNFTCKVPGSVDPTASTNFTFATNGYFQIYSTWSDNKQTYSGAGNGTAMLVCNTTSWTNSNWTLGALYSTSETTCSPAQLDITPTVSPISTQK